MNFFDKLSSQNPSNSSWEGERCVENWKFSWQEDDDRHLIHLILYVLHVAQTSCNFLYPHERERKLFLVRNFSAQSSSSAPIQSIMSAAERADDSFDGVELLLHGVSSDSLINSNSRILAGLTWSLLVLIKIHEKQAEHRSLRKSRKIRQTERRIKKELA